MAAEDDSDDKTRVGAAPPPPKLPTGRPTAPPAVPTAEDESDHTRIASVPPPQPKLPTPPAAPPPPASPEPDSDHTQIASAAPRPPVVPKAPSAPPPAPATPAPSAPVAAQPEAPTPMPPPQAAPPPAQPTAPRPAGPQVTRTHERVSDATVSDQTGDATVLITERVHVTMRLQRLQPAGRSEVIRLDRASYVLGRAHTCDIALFSASASREHARLTNHEGEWYIEPMQNKSVLVNGSAISESTLVTHKMHIQLGADELLFLDDRAAQASAAPASHRRSLPLVATIAIVVVGLAAVAIWWFLYQ